VLDATNAGMVFAGCEVFDHGSGTTFEHRTPNADSMSRLPLALHSNEILIRPSAVVARKTMLESVGPLDPSFPYCNDLEFWIRAHRSGHRIVFSGSESVRYRKHPGTMSEKSAELIADLAKVHVRHADWTEIPLAERRAAIARHFFNAARLNWRSRPALAGQQFFQALILPRQAR
jgi:GT2 family glycosyltransferase